MGLIRARQKLAAPHREPLDVLRKLGRLFAADIGLLKQA
jgi:hypothetical protein